MKAIAVYPGEKRIEVISDYPEPHGQLQGDAVRVRILDVGICGTDKEIASFQYGEPPAGSNRLIIGHESLGQVIETGPAVKQLAKNDLVVASVRRPCGDPACPACAIGRQDFCYTGKYRERGIKGLDGYMTEIIEEREVYLHKVPAGLQEVAVLTEPLTISQKALREIFNVQDRLPWSCSIPSPSHKVGQPAVSCRRALVLGAGPVGLLGAMSLIEAGFETLVYSRVSGFQERADITKYMGAQFIDADQTAANDLLGRIGRVDVVLEAVGASQLAFEVLALLGPNAIFVFTGVPNTGVNMTVDTGSIMRNAVLGNQAIIGTVNAGPEDFDSALASLQKFEQRWPGILKRLITQRVQPEDVPQVLAGHGTPGIKTAVAFSRAAF